MYSIVEFETNKYICGSYHQKLYQEKYNLEKFIKIIDNSIFKEHKEFNQISNFFSPSIEVISKEILDDIIENGLTSKERLELFLNDLKNIIDLHKDTLMDFDFNIVEYYYKSIRKNVMSKDSDVNLAKANTLNLIQEYQLIEKSIITKIINEISKLVQKNFIFVLFDFWYDDDENIPHINQNNITQKEIENKYRLLLIILMNKGITKKEITELFKKLCSYSDFYSYISGDGIYFKCDYPFDLENNYINLSEFRFNLMNSVNNLSIEQRFNRFIELLYEEKDCYYVFKILNTKIDSRNQRNEIKYGDIIYYNEKVFKSKGYENLPDYDLKDKFREGEEVKSFIKFKTKRYFPNISTLKVKSIIENNISLLKLLGNNGLKEKENYFKPSPSKMDVSYSHFVLNEEFYIISGLQTIYDGDNIYDTNYIYEKIYKNNELESKLNKYLTHLNYKQVEDTLTKNDELILQSLCKLKMSLESYNFSEILLHTWNGFEFLIKGLNKKQNKLESIEELVTLVYSFIYSNSHYKWDTSQKINKNRIENISKRLVIYSYSYRNKLVHSHLLEDSLMISCTKGLNLIFKELLNLIINKIIIVSDFNLIDIINQLKSELEKRNNERKNK